MLYGKAVQEGFVFYPSLTVLGVLLLVIIYCIVLLKSQHRLKIHHQSLVDSLQKKSDALAQTNSALREDIARITNSEGTLQGQNVTLQAEILQRKIIEEHLRFLAGLDSLTHLPNRSLFIERLNQAIARVPFHDRHLGVCYLNVDHFKGVNDTLGYRIGDLLLKAIGERLSSMLRVGDTVARMDGDTFALLCVDMAKGQDLTKIAQTVLEMMSKPVVIEDHELFSTVSIGISLSPEDGGDAETLLQHAETALSRAKEKGRNNWQYYSKEVNQSMLFRVEMENSLHHALERNELKLYYQPKLDLASNCVVGFEALVRWQHPRLGLVHPKEFIPLAEEIGLIVPIGEWVIGTACMQCKEWQQKGSPNLSIAVNISARQFQRENLTSQVRQVLNRSGLNPCSLELELTESLVQYSDEAVGVLTELSGMGVLIGVDDFGIGFSSLGYLKQLPISFIKIDQSFISGIPTDANDMAITTAIAHLGHSLNLKVIAEGVEEADQMQFLKMIHCDLIQGYLIGKPNPPEIAMDYLRVKKFYVS
ncbi:MAG: EAL domain-containing protein [Nitrospirae bacterium]|nr:EAL domain-containing protein [Candidatus Troglogloeales bacterium]